jgi:hypothetical protein
MRTGAVEVDVVDVVVDVVVNVVACVSRIEVESEA